MRFDHFGLGVLVFLFGVAVIAMLDVFVLAVFRVFVHDMFGIAQGGGVFGAFVRGVCFEFGAVGGAVLFDFLGFFLREFGFRGGLVFSGVEVRFFLALFLFGFFVFGQPGFTGDVDFLDFGFVFFEFSATDESVGFGFIGGFLVLGFGQFERERCGLLIVQFAFIARGGRIGSRGYGQFERRSFVPRRICAVSGKGNVLGNADVFVGGNGGGFGLGARIGQEPPGKAAGEAAGN